MSAEGKTGLGTLLLIYGLVLAGIILSIRALDVSLPLIGPLGPAITAVVLLYTPVLWARRAGVDLADYGFQRRPLGKGLALGLLLPLALFPLYALGFAVFFDAVCAAQGPLSALLPRAFCERWVGLGGFRLPAWGGEWAQLALVQLVVVALPEELFFRGFLLGELERALPPRRRFLGGGLGWALVLSAALFALAHLPRQGDPRALATFVPGLLFGWMRSATGSILAGTLAHALSNLWSRFLEMAFFQ